MSTAPHVTTTEDLRRVQDAKRMFLLIQEPRQEARTAGARAWEQGVTRMSNPWPVLSPEWASWDAGWDYESEANS